MRPEWIFMSVGGVLIALSIYRIAFGWLSLHWPKVDAEIEYHQIDQRTSSQDGMGISRGYRIKIRYNYVVNGKNYSGSRYHFGGASANERTEETIAQVSYMPSIPSFSVFTPGVTRGSFLILVTGLLFAVPFVLNLPN